MKRLNMVCAKCGSDDIVADAHAGWNVDLQRWEVVNVFDKGHYCNACDDECEIEEKEMHDQLTRENGQ